MGRRAGPLFRKWLILVHRYLGITLGLLFVTWFVSGIGMIYARGMPTLTPETRLQRLPPLDVGRVRISASEAAARAAVNGDPTQVLLLTAMDRPAYRFTTGRPITVFADTGEVLRSLGPAEAALIGSRFMNLPSESMQQVAWLTEADQWTLQLRRELPLYKIRVADLARSELYVSPKLGEIVLHTTRKSRTVAWITAIPHWLYFAPLRRHDNLWQKVVLWTSGLGTIAVSIGLVLAVIQFAVPYTGWMRWHYIAGAIFGVFTLTWVLSGMLSMQPGNWASGGISVDEIRKALAPDALDLSLFPRPDARAWSTALAGRSAKEVEFVRIQGAPYFIVRGTASEPELLAADSLLTRHGPLSVESLVERVSRTIPGVPILEAQMLSDFDSYYYGRDPKPSLPVLRVKLGDSNRTWLYLDPSMGHLVAAFTRRARLERWVYRGFHSLDFSFWYYRRPLWDIGVIALSLGGTLLSVIGVVIGFRRVITAAAPLRDAHGRSPRTATRQKQ